MPYAFVFLWMLLKFNAVMSKFRTIEGRYFGWSLFWFGFLHLLQPICSIIGTAATMQYYQIAVFVGSMCFLIIGFFTVACRKIRELRFLVVVTLVAFILAGISGARGLSVEGLEGARNVVSIHEQGFISDDAFKLAKDVYDIGLGGYGFMYVCAWVAGLMPFAVALTQDVKARILYSLVFGACVVCVKGGGLGTPMALIALQFLVFLVWLLSRTRKVVTIIGYSLIFIFALYATVPTVFSFLSEPFRALADLMGKGSFKERLVSLADMFGGDTSAYAYERVQLQMKSFNAFLNYPLTGVYGPLAGGDRFMLGGHSYLLDLLGGYGIFALGIYVAFLVSWFKYLRVVAKRWLGNRWLVMPTFFIAFYVFGCIANPVSFYANMAFLIPGIACLANESRGGRGYVQSRFMEPMPPQFGYYPPIRPW